MVGENNMNSIKIVNVESGREYSVGKLLPNELQYMDRDYIFNYIPEELKGFVHIRTCGNDKLIPENEPCFTMKAEHDVDIYILYPDKQPVIPKWLESFERLKTDIGFFYCELSFNAYNQIWLNIILCNNWQSRIYCNYEKMLSKICI